MTLEYKKIGFTAGLEIHQQLEGKKLFCNCPTSIREEKPDYTALRELRASVGESGEIDIAASYEQKKAKEFEYYGYDDTTCLVELDEEPVHHPNKEAVETAVLVSELFSMTIVDEVHPMRKTVVDGSNTSGFQRTMLISLHGKTEDVRVARLCLEEDACKIEQRTPEKDVYNLSRLGIPLLEITTEPDITSPEHLKEVAGRIGMILRSTGRVKRGLGSIRQDVNISVAGGERVEIKGVQDLQLMPVLATNEAQRQISLLQLQKELGKPPTIKKPIDVTKHFNKATGWIKKLIEQKNCVIGITIQGFEGVLGRELYKNYRLGTEIAGYTKSWGYGGIIHTDENPKKYGLTTWNTIKNSIGAREEDSILFLVGDNKKTIRFLTNELPARIQTITTGVHGEVRKANEDGTTNYLRPMPGAARMYPETDSHPIKINDISVELPELISERIPRMEQQYKIGRGVAEQILRMGRGDLFEKWAGPVPPSIVADLLGSKEKEMRRRHNISIDIESVAEEILLHLEQKTISKDAIEEILIQYSKTGNINWNKYAPLSKQEILAAVQAVIKEDPKAPPGALMGAVMKKLGGKGDGKIVSALLRKELEK